MADFESFNAGQAPESYDPAAFERFKEQIKKSAAQMAAARKDEARQKVKEDRLAAILLKLIKSNQKRGILLLAARLMQENIPPSFILAIIVLGNHDIAEEMRQELAQLAPVPGAEATADHPTSEFSLIAQYGDAAAPLTIKAELDMWGKGLLETASAIPFRILETCLDSQGNIKNILIDASANVLDDFLETNGQPEVAFESAFSFCKFLMEGIMKAMQRQIENQKSLGGSADAAPDVR